MTDERLPADRPASTLDFDDLDLPEGVDRAAVRRMHAVARLLDDGLRVPGTGFRVGLDPVLGLVPGVGDAISAVVGSYIVIESARLGVSWTTLLRMVANVGLDLAVGSVPVVGDLLDALFRAHRRNLDLALADLAEAVESTGPGGATDSTGSATDSTDDVTVIPVTES